MVKVGRGLGARYANVALKEEVEKIASQVELKQDVAVGDKELKRWCKYREAAHQGKDYAPLATAK